jgi:glucosyl-dolichyl phosphate glucuronosyltransferase
VTHVPGQQHSPPAISVVICAFTLERLEAIGRAIESVRRQTVQPHEIVLVIDHCPELLALSRERWPDVGVVPNRETPGLSGARNTGVAECTGDVVAFLDDDAIAAPDWLDRLSTGYADPRVVGVGGAVRPLWTAGRPRWFPPEFDWVVGCTHSGMPGKPSPVRNLVGANMSFRRTAFDEAGGFRHELGRVGTVPAGCEETELAIRVSDERPGSVILYDPAARVDHVVPPARGRLRYFAARCAAEGRSKAILSRLVGSSAGLESERSYTRRTLPRGVFRGLRDALAGDPGGAERAVMLGAGLLTTTAGYLAGRGLLRGAPARRGSRRRSAGELRVLMVTPRSPLGGGGVERHVTEVSRRVAAAGAEVAVLCAEPGAPGVSERRDDGVLVRSVPAWPAERDYLFAPRLWREMSREPWDLVHVQSYHTLVAPLAMLRALVLGIPYVVTFHGGGHSSGWRNRIRRIQRRALRPLLARAARLIAVARFEIELYGRELDLPPERFVLIPNGTDSGFDAAMNGADPGGPAVLASIGRLERYKGHHRVIAALPRVLERQPDARLLIVGNGPYEAALRRQAAELGVDDRVEFISVPANDPAGMAELLSGVSIVVLMSEFETHPLVALEAAAAGRRLLVADRAGLAEVAADGLAKAMSPDEPPGVIGDAIVEELGRPRPQRAPRLTSWDECAAELLALYLAAARA